VRGRTAIGNDGWSWPAGDATVQAYAQAQNHRLGKAGLTELKQRFVRQLRLSSLAEPLPDPRNRVTLAEQRDALGIPRPKLSYRTGDYARAGLTAARETHQRLFERLGATEVNHAGEPFGAGHIMGTCRMGADARTSVVDAELRVHGHRNCFVISTAVFPTVGTANPTLTLAALSLRAAAAVRRSLDPS